MRIHVISRTRTAAAATCLLLILAVGAGATDLEQSWTFDGDELKVGNMIGSVNVTGTDADEFRVRVVVRGEDAAPDLLQFLVEEGNVGELLVVFPVKDHDDYIYPELGSDSKTTITYRGDEDGNGSWIRKVFGLGDKITVRGKGRGLEVWADLEIEVPRDGRLEVRHGVGRINAAEVRGELYLDTHTGRIEVDGLVGDLLADTGSGSVEVNRVQGDVNVDTGSGRVVVRDVKGEKVLVDTGSGRVEVEEVDCAELDVDTGSGRVEARGVATDKARIDTGSGSVELALDRMGKGRFVIDTGSGSIDLALPADASARITADTGSGRVRNEIDGADIEHLEKDELLMTVGSGDARVTLDAGSGSITIRPL